MARRIERNLRLWFGPVLAVLLVNGVVSCWNVRNLAEGSRWVSHTREVLGLLSQTFAMLLDTETTQRGYLLTGEGHFEESYRGCAHRTRQLLGQLKRLTSDNPTQRRLVLRLEQLAADRVDELVETMDLRRRNGLDDASRLVTAGRGDEIMEEIRQQIAGMEREEERLLKDRMKEVKAAVGRTILTLFIATVSTSILLVSVYHLLHRDIRKRKQAEQILHESEHRFRSLTEALPQLVWSARPDGYCDYFNRKWTDSTGLTLEQSLGWGWSDTPHPEDRPRCLERWAEALRTGESYEIEYRLRSGDGDYRCSPLNMPDMIC